jgi:hypothetical protein
VGCIFIATTYSVSRGNILMVVSQGVGLRNCNLYFFTHDFRPLSIKLRIPENPGPLIQTPTSVQAGGVRKYLLTSSTFMIARPDPACRRLKRRGQHTQWSVVRTGADTGYFRASRPREVASAESAESNPTPEGSRIGSGNWRAIPAAVPR